MSSSNLLTPFCVQYSLASVACFCIQTAITWLQCEVSHRNRNGRSSSSSLNDLFRYFLKNRQQTMNYQLYLGFLRLINRWQKNKLKVMLNKNTITFYLIVALLRKKFLALITRSSRLILTNVRVRNLIPLNRFVLCFVVISLLSFFISSNVKFYWMQQHFSLVVVF